MKNLRGRLQRLERSAGVGSGRCPDCPPMTIVTEDAGGNVVDGAYPLPCKTCGGPHDGRPRFVVVQLPRDDAWQDDATI